MAENSVIELRPQPGRQEQFLSSSADIVIFGGAAGGGKTWGLLLEPLRHINNPKFGAVIFRRTVPELTREGGIWDEAGDMYPLLGAVPNQNEHAFKFASGAKIGFGAIQYDTDLQSWRSAQIPLIGFDQLETFTAKQFFYMMSRNRSMSGVRGYIRATCNPEPGWLADFLAWWIADDGYADLSRVGRLRYFVRLQDVTHWADTAQELIDRFPGSLPKSVTFIVSTIFDNKILLAKDPGYLSNLQAQDLVDRERLLGDAKRGGNWKIQPTAGKVFNRAWFQIVPAAPANGSIVRFWDLAATEKKIGGKKKNDPDYTASTKMQKTGGIYYILDATADQIDPAQTDTQIKNLAGQDGKQVAVRFEREGGASGKRDSVHNVTMLAGYDVVGVEPQGDKVTRAKAFSAQALAGNVKIVEGAWNEMWLVQMHGFPELPHDDIPDSASGAFNELVEIEIDWGESTGAGQVEEYNNPWQIGGGDFTPPWLEGNQ